MRFTTINTFSDKIFFGNSASVFLLDKFPDDDFMQNIAKELNIFGTTFIVSKNDLHFHVRWFSVEKELSLCSHSALAAGHFFNKEKIYLESLSGVLKVEKEGNSFCVDIPSQNIYPTSIPFGLSDFLNKTPVFVGKGKNTCFVELSSIQDVIDFEPNTNNIPDFPYQEILISANAENEDFDVAFKCFTLSNMGIDDLFTESAYAKLATSWSYRLKKEHLKFYMAGNRKGFFETTYSGDRVLLKGKTVTVFTGEFL